MAIEKSLCGHLYGLMSQTTPNSDAFVYGERALVITALALLIVTALAFSKVGAFAHFDSSIVGFSCLGGVALIALIKGFFLSLSLGCCRSYLLLRAHISPWTFANNDALGAISDQQLANLRTNTKGL